MEYNVIATDLDGTLLTSNKKITAKTKKVLDILKESGYFIVGVTARNLSSVKEVVSIKLFDYLILSNGSDIYDVDKDIIKNISHIDKDIINKLNAEYGNISPRIEYCSIKHYYIKTAIPDNSRSLLININDIKEIKEPISRINIFVNTKEEQIKTGKEIAKNYKNVNVTNMSDTDQLDSKFWLTINPSGINKLKTLELLCDDLKTTPSKVIFFGDGENDLPIIKGVGLGIAMKNAENIVKENADDITLSNDKEGVANYLEKYLIEKKNSKSDK